MSVSTVRAALITLLSGVAGVKRVYTHAPVSLPASDLPAVILLTGAATHAPAAMGRGTIKEVSLLPPLLFRILRGIYLPG